MAAVLRRVRLEKRPKSGQAVGGAGSPCGERVDAAGSVIAVEVAPCEVLDEERACRATLVVAAGASAELVPPSEVRQKPKRKPCRQQRKVSTAGTAIVGGDGGSFTSDQSLKEQKRSSILVHGPCVRKSRKSEEAKGSPTQTALSGWGANLRKATPGIGEERVRNPQARMRNLPPSSTGLKRLDLVRSCSVADSGKRDRKWYFRW